MGLESYAGRVALVTGASSGIGAAVTRALLSKGLTVVGLDRVKAPTLKHAPGKFHALEADVTNEDSILAAFKWIRENLSGVDVLINSAGVGNDTDLISGETEDWKRILYVNVLGLSICTREAVQDMLSRGVDDGFIIHISSIQAHIPPRLSQTAMYSASKHAVKTLLEGLRKDLVARKSKIRVGEVSPGLVRTEFVSNFKGFSKDVYEQRPCLESDDVAEAIVYMLSQHPRVQVHDIIIYPTGNAS